MKRPFNNAGFTQVQAEILSLSRHKRDLELEEMTENFETWMKSKFRLTANQREELAHIDEQYVSCLLYVVTERWRVGHPIHFYKDEPIRVIDTDPVNYRAEFVYEERNRSSLCSGSRFPSEQIDASVKVLLHDEP